MKKFIQLILIVIMFLSVALGGFALEGQYKNNLLNVELTQMPDNRVSVLLVFEKPYNDAIKVVYKTDNEYNILLPETYHSMTSISAINALNILSANVKLVPYFNQENPNGYTKISIKTTRPIVFNAHASYVTANLAQEDTLIQKLKNEKEFKIIPTTLPVPQSKTTQATAPKQTTVAKKPATTQKATTKQKQQPKAKPVQAKAKQQAVATKATQPKPQVKPQPTQQPKPVQQQPTKPVETQTATAPQTQPAPVDTTAATTPDMLVTTPDTLAPTQEMQEPVVAPPVATVPPQIEPQKPAQSGIMGILSGYTNAELGIAAAIGFAVFILLALLLRAFGKTQKNISGLSYQKTQQQPNYEPETDISEELKRMESLSWQEKYKAMKEHEGQGKTSHAKAQQEQPQDIQPVYTPEFLDDTVSETPVEENYYEPTQAQADFYTNDGYTEDLSSLATNDEVNDIFEEQQYPEPQVVLENIDDLSDVSPEIKGVVSPENLYDTEIENINITEPVSNVQPVLLNQTKISKTKGFYLIRYENEVALVGYIKDKVFLLQTFTDGQTPVVQTRLTEKKRGEDIYLIRANDYKALVGVTKNEMKTLIKL